MADPIQVPEGSPSPRVLLCWKQSKGMTRCDRMLNHAGDCSWKWEVLVLTAHSVAQEMKDADYFALDSVPMETVKKWRKRLVGDE